MAIDLDEFRKLVRNLHMADADTDALLKVADAIEALRRENEELQSELRELGELDV